MDILTQRFIAISNKLLAELRRIGDALGVLHTDSQQQVEAVNTAYERNSQQKEVKPVWLDDILAKYDKAEGKRTTKDDRHYRVQHSIRWATWCAFLAAAFYGAVAYRQWEEMIIATEATQQAVEETRRNRGLAEKSLSATIDQFHLEQRAWIAIAEALPPQFQDGNNKPIYLKEGQETIFGAIIANSGKTPAKHLIERFSYRTLPATAKFEPRYPGKPRKIGVFQPGLRLSIVNPATERATGSQIMSYTSGKNILYMYGSITYEDVFGIQHHATVCMYMLPDLSAFTDCETYTEAD